MFNNNRFVISYRATVRFFAAALVIPACLVSADQANDSRLMVDEMIVVLIDQNSVAANETGMIAKLAVREGEIVTAGKILGWLDDRRAKLEADAVRTQLQIAVEKSTSARTGDLAKKQLDEAKQLAAEHQLLLQIAENKAANETRVLASKKSQAVAKNELDRATRAREKFVDSVSKSEIEGLRLTYDRTQLESAQAAFERQIDQLQAKAELSAASGHLLRIERSTIEVERAIANEKMGRLEVLLYQQQLKLAQLATEKYKLLAPFNGVIAEIMLRENDWVTAGDAVLRVIRLDRLRADGFVKSDQVEILHQHRDVELEIRTGDDQTIQRRGQIVFVSSEIDPVNNEVKFSVEFDNPDRDVLPGMRLSLRTLP